eukprot:jgi/Chrzof1/2407/Cz11g14080.t1
MPVVIRDFSNLKLLNAEQVASLEAALQAKEVARLNHLRRKLQSTYQVVNAPTVQLSTGQLLPVIGLGTWKSQRGDTEAAVVSAIKAGYRHIDCAAVYGNEDEVGKAITTILQEGMVAREELFITTKLWNTDHGAHRVRAACLRSMKALQLQYLDLYLVHWPVTGRPGPEVSPPLAETWSAVADLVREGLVRAIGVSNFSIKKLKELMTHATIKPAVVQVEGHPYFRNSRLLRWCLSQGIHVTGYSPLGSPDSAALLKRQHSPSLLKDPVVLDIANKLGKDVGQVLIRWALQRGTSTLPKSVNPDRIKSNIAVFDWCLPPEDFDRLNRLPIECRMVDGSVWIDPRGPYHTLSELWDDDEPDDDSRNITNDDTWNAISGGSILSNCSSGHNSSGSASTQVVGTSQNDATADRVGMVVGDHHNDMANAGASADISRPSTEHNISDSSNDEEQQDSGSLHDSDDYMIVTAPQL